MESDVEPWDRFRDWLHSICVVTFDLELGQALEVIYPGDALLTNVEKMNICYLAFPDSNSGTLRDSNFHFRIRRSLNDFRENQKQLMETLPTSSPIDPHYLYGFVHFRQQKDATIRRGYFQKSIVLMTPLPFFSLFYAVTARIAQHFFESGEAAIEAACHHMDSWLRPQAGITMDLPLLGALIKCRLPSAVDPPYDFRFDGLVELSENDRTELFKPDFVGPIMSQIHHLQLLWELAVLGEPILIIAPSPTMASLLVQSIVSLVSPLKLVNDFRPYFTIHDSEFREYSAKGRSPPRVILGVTNPFFVKALDHWPHILKIDTETTTSEKKTRKNYTGRTLDTLPGFYTQYKPHLTTDKSLMKKLLKPDLSPEVQNSVLRRHFLELTQSFMIPLERYLSSLMPLKKEMSPFKSIPTAKPFAVDDFLATMDSGGPSLTCGVKGDWAGLYKKFVKTANFGAWLTTRSKDVTMQLKAHYVDTLCSADLGTQLLSAKHHVEIVDLVLRIRERVVEQRPGDIKQKLVRQIIHILANVDEELKQLLMSNCSLREVIS